MTATAPATGPLAGRRVVLVGGGIVGRAIAWRAATAGAAVTVVDDLATVGASQVAAGMLAPITEVVPGEQDLLELMVDSARRWPDFAAELEAAAGSDTGYRAEGTLVVGRSPDDVAALDDLLDLQTSLGLSAQRLRSREIRRHEPMLHPRVRGGLLVADDHRVDPRQVVTALRTAGAAAGVRGVDGRVATVDRQAGRVRGVTLDDGTSLDADRVVVTAGCWSGRRGGLPAEVPPPVRPVKGQLVVLRTRDRSPLLSRTVRGVVHGRGVYLVPRADGRLIVGASQEERGFDTSVTAGAVRELLDDATALVPGVDELELIQTLAGLRPGTPDNRPLIGPTSVDGLLLATGHHRHGVVLTPATADGMVALLADRAPHPTLGVADPRRAAIAAASRDTTVVEQER